MKEQIEHIALKDIYQHRKKEKKQGEISDIYPRKLLARPECRYLNKLAKQEFNKNK